MIKKKQQAWWQQKKKKRLSLIAGNTMHQNGRKKKQDNLNLTENIYTDLHQLLKAMFYEKVSSTVHSRDLVRLS